MMKRRFCPFNVMLFFLVGPLFIVVLVVDMMAQARRSEDGGSELSKPIMVHCSTNHRVCLCMLCLLISVCEAGSDYYSADYEWKSLLTANPMLATTQKHSYVRRFEA